MHRNRRAQVYKRHPACAEVSREISTHRGRYLTTVYGEKNHMHQLLSSYARFIAALLAFAFTGGALAAGIEDEINQIEERRYEAMAAGDTQALAQILADEFVYHQPSGAVATKASYIEQIKSGRVKIKTFERYGVSVHLY